MRAGATSCELRCTANVFGIDPRHATTVAAVTTAYAVMDCSDRDSAGIDTGSIDIVALSFGPPPTMRGSPDDATQRDIARVFPAHARAAAWWYYTHPSGSPSSSRSRRYVSAIARLQETRQGDLWLGTNLTMCARRCLVRHEHAHVGVSDGGQGTWRSFAATRPSSLGLICFYPSVLVAPPYIARETYPHVAQINDDWGAGATECRTNTMS